MAYQRLSATHFSCIFDYTALAASEVVLGSRPLFRGLHFEIMMDLWFHHHRNHYYQHRYGHTGDHFEIMMDMGFIIMTIFGGSRVSSDCEYELLPNSDIIAFDDGVCVQFDTPRNHA